MRASLRRRVPHLTRRQVEWLVALLSASGFLLLLVAFLTASAAAASGL